MRGERRLLRIGEYLITRACRRLPTETRDERCREWAAELPAILRDPGTRLAARRAARMLRYAADTIRGTALAPGAARRLMAHMASIAARFTIPGLVAYIWIRPKTPQDWFYIGIGFCIGSLILFGSGFAYRRWRGKGLGDELTEALEARTRTRREALEARARARREAFVARAFAGPAISMAGHTAGSFPRHKLGPGYRAAEVDELIARIEATLSGHARPAQAITATDVQAAKFKVTRHGGYDEQTVDLVLDHYADALARLASFPPTTAAGD
jgi:DivIVA domain-containing protein